MTSRSPPTFTSSTASLSERSPSPSRLPPSHQDSRRRNQQYQESARQEPSSQSSPSSSPPSARARLNHPGHRSPSALTFSSFPPPPSQHLGHRSPSASTFSSTSYPPPPPLRHSFDHSPSLPLVFSPLHSDDYQQPQKQQSQYHCPANDNFTHTTSAGFPLVPPPVPSSQSITILPRRESSYDLTFQPSHSRPTQSSTYSPTSNPFDSHSSPSSLNLGAANQRYATTTTAATSDIAASHNRPVQPLISSPTANSFDSRSSPSSLNSGVAYQRYTNTDTTAAISDLTPPQPSYIPSQSRPSVSRPNSVVSFSAYSTYSNEPLNQSKSSKASTKLQKLYSLSKRSSANTMSTLVHKDGSSSITRVSKTRLDLPEHRGMYSSMNPVNINDPSHLVRRSSQSSTWSSTSITSRKRGWKARWDEVRPRKYNPQDYNVKGFGRRAQFSNERLYLHWIRFGVLQGSIAVMLLSFGIGVASWVGVGTLILSLLTLIYATQLFHKRHLFMVTKRKDVKFFARTIPTLLTFGLFFLYGGNFALTMYYGEEARNPPPWTRKDPTSFNIIF
ncbi:MAG: hypothetical protein JOS17DRAFT_790647 [Linnemannia elongata]|nr:MAG: hypothetical protein JOS17DRAFT_790647 [Linnemannia elongata]